MNQLSLNGQLGGYGLWHIIIDVEKPYSQRSVQSLEIYCADGNDDRSGDYNYKQVKAADLVRKYIKQHPEVDVPKCYSYLFNQLVVTTSDKPLANHFRADSSSKNTSTYISYSELDNAEKEFEAKSAEAIYDCVQMWEEISDEYLGNFLREIKRSINGENDVL